MRASSEGVAAAEKRDENRESRSMGNTLMCCAPGPKTVRIHQEKGKIMEFYSPILASKLMLEYPNHLIVYRCINGKPGTIKQSPSFNSKAVGQNAEVRVVRASTKLELGHAYFLVHIPEQYLARFSKYFNVANSQVAPAPAAPSQAPTLGSAAAAAAAGAGSKDSRNSSSNSSSNARVPKRKSSRPSKPGSKSSRHRRSPRGSPGHKKSSGRGLWGGESSASISSRKVCASHDGSSNKSSGLTYYQYYRSKYARQSWRPLLSTIAENDES